MKRHWWQETIGYQIYPSTFFDSNNDGIGDIVGIIKKLDYLKALGVNCLWICPFFASPMDDNGYDVSDYYQINKMFGDLKDVKELIKEAHQRGLKIIIDLVLNQTSDEHQWFMEAKTNKDSPYHDYYIWKKPRYNTKNERIAPTNWSSFFADSAWCYQEEVDEYYLKIFSKKMPDLNWENKECRIAMFNVARYWLDLGIDGFRLDAIAHLAKDLSFTDSKLPIDVTGYVKDWSKFSNRPKLFDYLNEFKDEVLSKYDALTVGEVGGGISPKGSLKFNNFEDGSINMVFNFEHCWLNGIYGDEQVQKDKIKVDVVGLKKVFLKWYKQTHKKSWQALYWLNHDHPRVISQYGDPLNYHRESAIALANVLYLMPGTPFVYNGEEIGMTNVDYQEVEDFKDVWVKNMAEDAIKRLGKKQFINFLQHTSRINARTPFHWSAKSNAGFTVGVPFTKVVGNYLSINVESQDNDPNSILNHYRWLFKRRNSEWLDLILDGEYQMINLNHPDVFAYQRSNKFLNLITINNLRSHHTSFRFNINDYDIVYNNYSNINSVNKKLELLPWQSLILVRKL